MYATYHLSSAEEVNTELLDAIKATFKAKPITIIVEEDEDNELLSAEMKSELDNRLGRTNYRIHHCFGIYQPTNNKYGL